MSRLKQLRINNKITLKKLSEKTGISVTMLRYYEIEKTQPTADRLVWLADYYKVSVDYILGRRTI